MYKCIDCGALFEDPEWVSECIGEYWGQPAYQDFAYCPECRSDLIDEVEDEDY